jgi:hypothetical protein
MSDASRNSLVKLRVHFLLLVVLALGIAAFVDNPSSLFYSSRHLAPTANSVTIWLNGDVVGSNPGWNNTSPGPTMVLTSGVEVHLFVNATDPLLHNWFIDTRNDSTPDPNGISSPDFSFSTTGAYNFTFTPIIGQNIPSAGNWTYRCRYHPTIMYGTIRILASDFSITASQTVISTVPESTASTTITLSSPYSETVNLSTSASIQASISPVGVLAPGTATLTVHTSNTGNYTVTITGIVGTFIHSLNITVRVSDFTISTDPTTIQAQTNAAANSTIGFSSTNHFSGQIALSTNSSYCNVTPAETNASENAKLSCIFPVAGIFRVSVTAVSGPLTKSSTVIYDITAVQVPSTSSTNWTPIIIVGLATTLVAVGIAGYFRMGRRKRSPRVQGRSSRISTKQAAKK